MRRLDAAVFSCGVDENDIDQDPGYVRADGELVADTSFAACMGAKGADRYLAERIVVALNHVRGLTVQEIKTLSLVTAQRDALLVALGTVMAAHRFNVSSMTPAEVHAACYSAIERQKGSAS